MGGRGAYSFSTCSIPVEKRDYESIGNLDSIKALKHKSKEGKTTPVMSNTASTIYALFSKKENRITTILFYKNHVLYRSVDIEDGGKAHAHNWEYNPDKGTVMRQRHDIGNVFSLTEKEKTLVNKANKWKQ